MIDSDFIIKYTNALYSTPAEFAPRYDEFRDMFSSGQIQSKEWLVKELGRYLSALEHSSAIITGAWYGTLGILLRKAFPTLKVNMLDIDPRCEKFVNNIIYNEPDLKYVTSDMYKYHYNEKVIINTSCEHIPNISEWINIIPAGRIVVLQSNNYYNGAGHINCVKNETELADQSGLSSVWYAGKLEMPMYTRYMIIGYTK